MTDDERYANLKSNLLANKKPVKKSYNGNWKGSSDKNNATIEKIAALENRIVSLEETVNGLLELLSEALS